MDAVLAVYKEEPGEERLVDQLDAWAATWSRRIGTLLRLPAEGVVCLDSQEGDENRRVKTVLLPEIERERTRIRAAEKARKEDEVILRRLYKRTAGVRAPTRRFLRAPTRRFLHPLGKGVSNRLRTWRSRKMNYRSMTQMAET